LISLIFILWRALTRPFSSVKVAHGGYLWGNVSVLVFQGASALSVDGKGRVTIPSRHRELLMAAANGELTITRHPVGCLMVFPRPSWEQFRDKLMTLPWSADPVRRIFLGNAMDVTIDSASRVLVSPELRKAAGIVKDVTMLGMGSRLELWDRDRHIAHEAEALAAELPDAIKEFVF
jgi:MraZ protein